MPTYYARTEYTGNGVITERTINWDTANGHYVAASDVKVSVNGVELENGTDFTVSGNTITFAVAPGNGEDIIIYRKTALAIIEQFARLGTPSSGGFNAVMRRLQYIAQELSDTGTATLSTAVNALLAERWAQYTGGDVPGAAAGDRSAKSWAQEDLEGATYGGSAKDWAQSASKPDGVNESAKTYAGQASTSAGDALNSAAAASASAASLTYATITEALTGTATNRIVNPDTLAALWEQGTDIASATALPIPNTGGGYFFVTGTTTITSIDQATAPKTGRTIRLKFNGILTLTHNATNLILPGGANITTAAGDVATFVCEGTAATQNWRCVDYQRADGTAVVAPTVALPVVVLQDQKSSGTDGGTSSASAWTNHILNTEVIDTGNICTLGSNQFTLPAGTWLATGFMAFENGNQCMCRIRNITDGTTPILGIQGDTPSTTGATVGIAGAFTTAGTKTFSLQYWSTSGSATTGLGRSNASGTNIYASLVLTKID